MFETSFFCKGEEVIFNESLFGKGFPSHLLLLNSVLQFRLCGGKSKFVETILMHRFFITNEDRIGAKDVVLASEELVHQMFSVLRFKPGEEVVLLDGSGEEWVVLITDITKKQVAGKVLEKRVNEAEPAIKVCLYQSLLKHMEKFEWVLQKGTEIGFSTFVPLVTARTERPVVGKIDRLERILKEASEQSGRGVVPVLGGAVKFKDVKCEKGEVCVIADPKASVSLKDFVSGEGFKKAKKINIFVGPEGGFTDEEVSSALERGFVGVNLGKRILRSETAGVVMGAVIL